MNPSRKKRKRLGIIPIAAVLIIMLIVCLSDFSRTIILRQYDAVRLASFSRRIADADRAVAIATGGSTTLTFTGADLGKILRGVSAGRSARMPDSEFMSSPFASVTFLRGTNVLGRINMSSQLFNLHGGPQFFDNSELLNRTVYPPLRQKVNEAYASGTK